MTVYYWYYIIDPRAIFRDVWFWFNGTTPSLYMILNTRLWMLQHLVSMVVCEIAYKTLFYPLEFFEPQRWTRCSFQVNSGLLSQWNPSLARTWFFLHQSRRGQNIHRARSQLQLPLNAFRMSQIMGPHDIMMPYLLFYRWVTEFKSLRFFKVPCCSMASQACEHVWVHSVSKLTFFFGENNNKEWQYGTVPISMESGNQGSLNNHNKFCRSVA